MKIQINVKTAKALDRSIEKWVRVVESAHTDAPITGEGRQGCGLCTLFNGLYLPLDRERCVQCPIALDTGEGFCHGTPYDRYGNADDYLSDEALEAAKDELAYLQGLKSRCVVVPGIRLNRVEE